MFNSPFMRNSGRMPTIRGVEVEQHLTISAKDLLRQGRLVSVFWGMIDPSTISLALVCPRSLRFDRCTLRNMFILEDSSVGYEPKLHSNKGVGPREQFMIELVCQP